MRIQVCFAGPDRSVGEVVTRGLRLAGHEVEASGDAPDWAAELAQIRQAEAIVAVASRAAVGSPRWTAQWQYARALGKPLVSLIIEPGDRPLAGSTPVDFTAGDALAAFALVGAVAGARPAAPQPDPLPLPPPEPMGPEPRAAADDRSPGSEPAGTRNPAPGNGRARTADALLTPADIHGVRFAKPPFGRRGYDEEDVDALLDEAEGALQRRLDELAHPGRSVHPIGLTADDLRNVVFRKPPIGKRGYVEDDVDAFLDLVARSFETLDSDLANRR